LLTIRDRSFYHEQARLEAIAAEKAAEKAAKAAKKALGKQR
jgi:hypothetical protein